MKQNKIKKEGKTPKPIASDKLSKSFPMLDETPNFRATKPSKKSPARAK